MAKSTSVVLADDIIFEILTWTGIHIFSTLRMVCKRWRNLLSDPNFLNNHHQTGKGFRGFLQKQVLGDQEISFLPDPYMPLSCQGLLPSFDFLPAYEASILASTPHGLVLCSDEPILYVCKPTTREWIEIPSPRWPSRYGTMKWVMAVAPTQPLRFKIARIVSYDHEPNKPNRMEIFDSNSWGPWKEVVAGQNCNPWSATLVNRWLCSLNRKEEIVCLDMWTEELVRITLPSAQKTQTRMLNEIDGGLGLVCEQDCEFEFWRMTRWACDNQRWEKDGSLKLKPNEELCLAACSTIVDGAVLMLQKNSQTNSSFDSPMRWLV